MRWLCPYKYLIWIHCNHQMWPGALVYIHFIILAYVHEQIWLPHSTFMSHCTATVIPYTDYLICKDEGSMLIYAAYILSNINNMIRASLHRGQWCHHWEQWWCSPTKSAEVGHWPIQPKTLPCMKVYKHAQTHLQADWRKICDSNVKIIQNKSCQVHHTLPMWLPTNMSSFKSTTPCQCKHYPKPVISRLPHTPEVKVIPNQSFKTLLYHKVKMIQISAFLTTTFCLIGNGSKSVLSSPPHPPKVTTNKNESFQEYHTLQKLKLTKISPLKTTIPSQIETVPCKVSTPTLWWKLCLLGDLNNEYA